MITYTFTFDSTQDISRHPVIIESRKRHLEIERARKLMFDEYEKLMRDGFPEIASSFLSCSMIGFNMRFF